MPRARRTQYSNGLIGLYEELGQHEFLSVRAETGDDQDLLLRFIKRQRALIETDMLIVANDHWNFDVRGFEFFTQALGKSINRKFGDGIGAPVSINGFAGNRAKIKNMTLNVPLDQGHQAAGKVIGTV